jgi:N-acetylglucosaminyl-diphospho-decaprenol L-rhamnosyltransferase
LALPPFYGQRAGRLVQFFAVNMTALIVPEEHDNIEILNAGIARDLTIIIVSYNTRNKTVDCVRSIRGSTSASYEIIVIDNGSTDESVEALHAAFPELELIASRENLGFASASNLAEKRAHGRQLLFLNPDTIICGHAIDDLHRFALANPDCRIWGGRCVRPDGTLDWSCWKRMTLWNAFCFAVGISFLLNHPREYRRWKHDTPRTVDVIAGCFLLIDRDLWKQLNGFDPLFFMYGEDEDLCLRARRLGARPTYTPSATIIHYGTASEQDEAERRIKLMAGEITLMKRHWSPFAAFIGRLIYLFAPHPRWVGYGVLGLIMRRANFRQEAATWWQVWRCRRRWVNGWRPPASRDVSSAAVSSVRA